MIEGNLSNQGEGFSVISCNASLNSIVLATKKDSSFELIREASEQRHLASIHYIPIFFTMYS